MKTPISRSLKYFFELPKEALYFLSGKNPIQVENKILDSGLQVVVSVLNAMPPFESLAPVDARKVLDALSGLIEYELSDTCHIHNTEIPVTGPIGKIPIRIYTPGFKGKEKLPVLVYSHGGGYVIASLDSHDRVCQLISQGADCIVISVGYRLAPEFKFPTAAYDVIDAFKWVVENISKFKGDRQRIAIGGDSAGGTLATVASHELKRTEYRPYYQLLIYPGSNASRHTKSREIYGDGFFLTGKQLDWFIGQYLNNSEDVFSPLLSPMLYSDFSELPPVYIATAGLDPIYDDGFEYAEKLRCENIAVTYRNFPTLIHGYMNMSAIPACKVAVDDAIGELKKAFYG